MSELPELTTLAASMAYLLGGGTLAYGLVRGKARLALSLAKHRSLSGHPRMARRMAAQLPNYTYSREEAFAIDGAPQAVVDQRKAALVRLGHQFKTRFENSLQRHEAAEPLISDMQFVAAYKLPYQFREQFGPALKTASFVQSSKGVTVTDLDGNVFYDLTGSYGVNLLGNDFYKACIAEGSKMVAELGPVLGAYHPLVEDNARRLVRISGMDEVSFHMSGTEAVMQAVRLARYHTKRTHVARFCGAYHGWWGDVQPGIGNPMTERETHTFADMSDATLQVIRKRKDIACILVNPLQAMHPNAAAPGDSALLDSSRKATFDREGYTLWLQKLRQVCTEKNIALIFDEVFVGFRLATGGAQEFFGVQADMVTYGKTLGGGLPVGVVCGKHAWMKRFRDHAPVDICFARGTFNSHPYVMGAMNSFLRHMETPQVLALCKDQHSLWNERAARLNQRLAEAGLPLQVANMTSIWTVLYRQPACYNWMLQYYMRLEGLALSWVGTGRFIFSLNYTEADFEEVCERFIKAAQNMQSDGWWWHHPQLTNPGIKRRVFKEMLAHRF